jgi:hypothetical protein
LQTVGLAPASNLAHRKAKWPAGTTLEVIDDPAKLSSASPLSLQLKETPHHHKILHKHNLTSFASLPVKTTPLQRRSQSIVIPNDSQTFAKKGHKH